MIDLLDRRGNNGKILGTSQVVLKSEDLSVPVLDPTHILAKAAVREAFLFPGNQDFYL